MFAFSIEFLFKKMYNILVEKRVGVTEVKTNIIIVRHGESLGNSKRIMLGCTDLDMSQRGYEQAAATARFLADEKIDAIYSSDLIRAYNTAVPHAELRGIKIITDERLREMHVGTWENRPFAEIAAEETEMYVAWREKFGTLVFPSGESIADAGKRFHGAIVDIAEKCLGKTVLVTTHAGVLRSFWGQLLGLKLDEIGKSLPFATNASVSRLVYEDGKLTPLEYSTAHFLEEIGFLVPGKIGK